MTSTLLAADDININMASDDTVHVPTTRMYIKNVPGKGRGVYAGEDIPSRKLINISPVLLFPEGGGVNGDCGAACGCPEREILAHYTYTYDKDTQALALGMGSMFNHARKNNVGFVLDKENLLIRYTTVHDVTKDSELLINYGNRLWFVDESEGCGSDGSGSDEDVVNPFSNMDL
mmetsp:Transcript_15147/g.25153  ORF Transcript_15147/g.25153 Transcript_15147/m.25153 type:complete len:175 (+) Transcript_15147:140-664(+)|eukprot:CAMPEP_0114413678 /NCGR_PEP_ID=MMETSP0103-20121206/982_1 /TAXON_ID=37642 ORGANISM="Paraphysomonas imperforata, Strain PA2" /NCGR_SAMPLE_ID=MMETSP0103 /ASSEMBLY_ACC=CAM_ASM_000201 /LENGTH=174 /DNA_ID=CAMNT_0001581767 /DNA_START=118 /DNA_END=642 /DNA_ORIENTATION=+